MSSSVPCHLHAKNLQLSLRQADTTQSQTVSTQTFDSVYTHPAHHVLNLKAPPTKQVHQTFRGNVWVYPFGNPRITSGDAPRTFSSVAFLADRAANRYERCSCDVHGVSTQSNRFNNVSTAPETASSNN